MTHRTTAILAVCLTMCSSVLRCAAASVYTDLMAELTSVDHRLPGSEQYDHALNVVRDKLSEAGLETHVQTFSTLVPHTEWCRLTVDGVEVGPVHPVNNGIAPLATPGEISGPLVWIEDGTLQSMTGKPMEGCIALMSLSAPDLKVAPAFLQGARAVIFVGSEAVSQWNVDSVVFQGVVTVPRLFISRDTAEKAGLLGTGGKRATIAAKVVLRDVVAKNLWVALPGTPGKQFRLGNEEAVILSASLDTFGFVPDYCPDVRLAANAALLADVACGLAGRQLDRTLVFVFFGSHYAAQEGSRLFYYALAADRSADLDSLESRAEKYQKELAATAALLGAFESPSFLTARDDVSVELTNRMKEKLLGWVNSANAMLQDLRLEKDRLQQQLRHGAEIEGYNARSTETRIAEIDTQVEAILVSKRQWNALRRQITEREYGADDPDAKAAYEEAVAGVRAELDLRTAQVSQHIDDNRSFQELAAVFKDRSVIGHFDFDFANAVDPWLFSVIGAYDMVSKQGLDTGSFLMHLRSLGKVYGNVAAQHPEWQATLLTEALNPFYKPFSLCVPAQRIVPTTVGVLIGVPGYQLMTVADQLREDGLPLRRERDLSGLTSQMREFVQAIGMDGELSLRSPFAKERIEPRLIYSYEAGENYSGIRFVNYSRGSSDIEGPAQNAVLWMKSEAAHSCPSLPGASRWPLARISASGHVFSPMLSRECTRSGQVAYGFGYDDKGRLNRYSLYDDAKNLSKMRIPLFYGYGGAAFSYGFGPDMLGLSLVQSTHRLSAKSDGPMKNSCTVRTPGMEVFFTDKTYRVKFIGGKGDLNLGSLSDTPQGIGITRDPWQLISHNGVRQGANDYWILNESRLKVLRERNIISDALESLHAEAGEHLQSATQSREEQDYSSAQAHEIAATCLENRVYLPLKGITQDLVRAVIVLLLLNIPFAFAMERLVFGFTSIYKQVLGFVGFFVVTFGILFFTHPAFSLADAPVVIFLAFVIILLSSIVVYIVLTKIKLEIRAIQGLASTVHGTESDGSTGLAAVLIGISGMRNRPLKTFLTATSVTLLTFTILVFASFTARLGVVNTYLGKGQGEDRIELHRFSFLDVPDELVHAVGELYGEDFHIFRRGGLFLNPTKDADKKVTPLSPDPVVYSPASGKVAGFGALLGVDSDEVATSAGLRRLAPGLERKDWPHPPILLPATAVERLEVKIGDEVKLLGKSFTYAGEIDTAVMQNLTTIEGTKVMPPDFDSTIKNLGKTMAGGGSGGAAQVDELEQIDIGSFAWFSPERVAVADINVMQSSFPKFCYINFLSLYPKTDDVDIRDAAEKLAPIFQGAVHVKSDEGASKLFFTRAVEGSGFADVIVPLLLGGLIIFSSLMGSIVDREREIFTYSALGLAPPDVGALFFAESAVYSVVGGMGGYLFSQVVAKLLTFLGSKGVFHPPEMNFSSLSSVMTILVVMAVVILSTIYPAIAAGKSANPGVARRWRMPAPKGNRLQFVFPFTVSAVDFAGILSFVREHFENHGDATLGNFAARKVRLFRTPAGSDTKESLGISADISLAPFDLGIFQRFRMYSTEFEIKGIDEVVVELERIGGTPAAWVRGNRTFANELRKQFLLWRSLPIETVEHYRSMTTEALGQAPGHSLQDSEG